MNYLIALDYINSFINFENIPEYNYASSFKLERMYSFLQELGNPHYGLNVLHIAGSKGKGSTCAIIASILRHAGYCVGLYTSPHLVDIRERIRVLESQRVRESKSQSVRVSESQSVKDAWGFEGCISEDEFVRLVEKIKPVAERFREDKKLGRLSFFEFITACAFLYFQEKNVQFVVLETGLGGRLDATNVTVPIVCGITNISIDHTLQLGNSLEAIAREKAGIIKNQKSKIKSQESRVKNQKSKLKTKNVVVISPQRQEVRDVIRKVCMEKRKKLYEICRDVHYYIVHSDENRQIFDIDGTDYSYKNLKLNLIGKHQVENACLSIAMVKAIDKVNINENAIRNGLKDVFWPGRLEIILREPYVVIDGAHNTTSIKVVLSSVQEIFKYDKLIIVFGMAKDKDIKGVSRLLEVASDTVIITKSMNKRAEEPSKLGENFSQYRKVYPPLFSPCRFACANLIAGTGSKTKQGGQRKSLKSYRRKAIFLKTRLNLTNNVQEALELALKIADKNDLVLVTGSLYIVGEALGLVRNLLAPKA